jgi:hypothetical protein
VKLVGVLEKHGWWWWWWSSYIYEQQLGELHKKEGSNLEALNSFGFLGFINSK